MEDFIVIIITLLIVVIGAIGQIKKKQRVDVAKGKSDESGENNFWDELLGEDEKTYSPRDQAGRISGTEPEKPAIKKQEQPISMVKEGVSAFKNKPVKKEEVKLAEIGSEAEKSSLLEGFSLKKAIIFSEIIQTKYF